MTTLHIDSSITGENSVSRVLTASIVDKLRAADPDTAIVRRDLASEPLERFEVLDGQLNVRFTTEHAAAP